MFANVFAKTLRDRWMGWTVASGVLASFVLLGMYAYNGLDISFVEMFPDAYQSLLGLTEGIDAGALAISAIFGSYGSMTVAAMAMSMGAASIAGEERKGTIGLLLANPTTRTNILVSKIAAMLVLATLATIALAASSIGFASLLNVSLGDLDVVSLSVHMLASSLFYGMLATAVGGATGNRGAAIGVSTGVLVIGFLGAGLLPLLENGEDWVGIFPWYYFNGSQPLNNGVDWGHIGFLLGFSALFAIVGLVGFNRRDLKGQSVGVTMIDRLRANPLTRKVADRLAGTARVSSIWAKTASEHQVSLMSAIAYMLYVQLMLGAFWRALPEDMFEMLETIPESFAAMLALFGGGDMSTPAGWFQIETFGMMAPIMIMVVTISIGSNALAGEEARRTMGLLLANPIPRSRVIAEKTFTMVVYASMVGLVSFIGTWLGSLAGGMDLSLVNIAAICVLLTVLGMVGGSLALAIGAGTGRKSMAVWGAVGVMIATHVMNSLGEIAGNPAWQKLSPFYYYLGSDPLNNGFAWGDTAVLAVLAVVLIGAANVLVQRRDIKEGVE